MVSFAVNKKSVGVVFVAEPNLARGILVSSRHVGDFQVGYIYYHGAVQITPFRDRMYISKFNDGLILGANPDLAERLGYKDPGAQEKRKRFGIEHPALASQGFLFNLVFGLSVHDISFNTRANLSYSDLRYGTPVFEGDTIYAKSEVLGVRFARDGTSNGAVQVKTMGYNQREEVVLEYVRTVLVNAEPGKTYNQSDGSRLQEQPAKIDLGKVVLPNICGGLPRELLGGDGKTFEQFEVGETYRGLFESSVDLETASWLQIATMNDAAIHQTPPNFIVYGGTVKAVAEGQVSGYFPLAYHLGMNNGSHIAPTYPSDMVERLFLGDLGGPHEQLRSRIEVLDASTIEGRGDIGILTIKLIAEKLVTDAGLRALATAEFRDRPQEFGGYIPVLSLEEVIAVPKEMAFR